MDALVSVVAFVGMRSSVTPKIFHYHIYDNLGVVVLSSRKEGRELSRYPQISQEAVMSNLSTTCATEDRDFYLTKGFVLKCGLYYCLRRSFPYKCLKSKSHLFIHLLD